jgi:glycine cleavage system protein P-like pyridoxal-binding family
MAVDVLNTKFSNIDLAFVKGFLRIEPDFTEDDVELQLFIDAARSFVLEQTQLTAEELDNAKQTNIVFLKTISDLYHNRSSENDEIFKLVFKSLRNYNNIFGTPEV